MIDLDALPDEWTEEAVEMYTAVYTFSVCNQAVVSHPAAPTLSEQQWHTLCHNMAFLAAAAREGDCLVVTDGNDRVLATQERGTLQ